MTDDIEFSGPSVVDGEIEEYDFDGSGTTVLAFFPGAFTGPCTEEMCNFRDEMSEFNDLDAKVVGISVDTAAVKSGIMNGNTSVLTCPHL
ncbi:MAG: redoxin domain-containing protein [Candidatus Nanosalina sp.]